MERKVIKTINLSNRTTSMRIKQVGNPQGMAILSNNVVYVFSKGSAFNCLRYTTNGLKLSTPEMLLNLASIRNNARLSIDTGLSSGLNNGATYCDHNDTIYIATKGDGTIVALTPEFKYRYSFKLPVQISSVAYDKDTGAFYGRKGNKLYKFARSVFSKNGNRKNKPAAHTILHNAGQDIAVYKAHIYCVVKGPINSYVDVYRTSDFSYAGSIKIEKAMVESVVFNSRGNLIYSTSDPDNRLVWTGLNPSELLGKEEAKKGGKKQVPANEAFVATALKELKLGVKEIPAGSNRTKYGEWFGMNGEAWCAIFVCWCAYTTFGENKWKDIIPRAARASDIQDGLKGPWIKNNSMYRSHVGIIATVKGTTATTVEGNTGSGEVGSRTCTVPSNTQPGDIITFNYGTVARIRRPKWPDGLFTIDDDGTILGADGTGAADGTSFDFNTTTQQLYSSDNYKYVAEKKEDDPAKTALMSKQGAIKDFLSNINPIFENPVVSDISLPSTSSIMTSKKPKTKISKAVSGSPLPSASSYVEAPYINIKLGGVNIGTYNNGNFPNYLNGLTVKKTNGSLNEYVINLTHQIAPGDNPNYIDNLIAANGYNKIVITYGDANSGIQYQDFEALLINATSNFDFFNNCINYTLYATSSSVMSVVTKRNYPEVTDKPSNIINKMLYTTGELLQFFPGMRDSTVANSMNLIPSNDKEVTIDAMANISPLSYLNTLVGAMSPNTSKDSNDGVYYLRILDDIDEGAYFKIDHVSTSINPSTFPLVYEVDINYPEMSTVYNFSVESNFSWPLAYEYGGGFSAYNYDINNAGQITSSKASENLKSIAETKLASTMDKNWWTNVTEFPVKASLEVKGLSAYVLLLNYIKINVFYFGNKLNSSGIYIVLGQEDTLSGNGFRTKLDLLRVAGDNQYINVDGRIVT